MIEALDACAGVILNAVVTAVGVVLHDATISAEGDLDFRGTLGVERDAPVCFEAIRLNFDLHTEADSEQLDTLLGLTGRYCMVLQSLANPPALAVIRNERCG